MFPITCSAVGDIIAIAQLTSDIINALSDVRGSAQDFRELEDELRISVDMFHSISSVVDASDNSAARTAVFTIVRRWSATVEDMFVRIVKFTPLREDSSVDMDVRARLRRGLSKLQWRLSRSAEARECRVKLEQYRSQIVLALNIASYAETRNSLNNLTRTGRSTLDATLAIQSDTAALRESASSILNSATVVQNRTAHTSSMVSATRLEVASVHSDVSKVLREALTMREEIGTLRTSFGSLDQRMNLLNDSMRSHPALQSAATGNSAAVQRLAEAIVSKISFWRELLAVCQQELASGSATATRAAGTSTSPLLLANTSTSTIIAAANSPNQPIAMLSLAIVAVSSADVRWGVALASLFALLRLLARQQRTIASPVYYSSMNTVILIDLLGRRTQLTIDFCASPEALHHVLLGLFDKKAGYALIQKRRYELTKAGGDIPIPAEEWSSIVRCGIELEMNAIVVKEWSVGLKQCPRCGTLFSIHEVLRPQTSWMTCSSCAVELRTSEIEHYGSSNSPQDEDEDEDEREDKDIYTGTPWTLPQRPQSSESDHYTENTERFLSAGSGRTTQPAVAFQARSPQARSGLSRALEDLKFCRKIRVTLRESSFQSGLAVRSDYRQLSAHTAEHKLYLAAVDGLTDDIALLLRASDVNINACNDIDFWYGTALQAAAYCGHIAAVRLLLAHGADPCGVGGYYGTALQAAAREGHVEIAELLISHGADVNATGGEYWLALHAAARGGHAYVTLLLLDRGADISMRGGRYGTALLSAAVWGHTEVVKLLLDHGADINAMDSHHGTALQAAAAGADVQTVLVLLARGADVNIVGGALRTALDAALAIAGNDTAPRVLPDSSYDEQELERLAALRIVNLLIRHGARTSDGNKLGPSYRVANVTNIRLSR